MRVRAAPARHVRHRDHDERRPDVPLPGARRTCLPGRLHVLHPDETHDGAAGTDAGFGYRIIYVAPELVRDALGGLPLPFVADPVPRPAPASARMATLLADIHEPLDDLRRTEIVTVVADVLLELGDGAAPARGPVDLAAVERVREHLAAHPCEPTTAAALERIADADRYTIARHFRRAFGTSPDRYRTLRRLERARAAIARGEPLARIAAETGFADQSHLTRQFKRAYGMTPGRWAALMSAR